MIIRLLMAFIWGVWGLWMLIENWRNKWHPIEVALYLSYTVAILIYMTVFIFSGR